MPHCLRKTGFICRAPFWVRGIYFFEKVLDKRVFLLYTIENEQMFFFLKRGIDMGSALLTLLKIAAGAAIIFGFIYEKKLIAFEDRLCLLCKKFLKKRRLLRMPRMEKQPHAKHCA